MDNDESFVVENGRLKIMCKIDQGWNPGWETQYYQKPVLKINNSDSWSDYEVTWDAYVPDSSVQQANVVVRMENSWENGYEAYIQASSWGKVIASSISRINSKGALTKISSKESVDTLPYVAQRDYYGKMSAIGPEIKLTLSDADNNVITKLATDSTYQKGAIGFTGAEADAMFDNITVTDKNAFNFAPDKIKNVGKEILLTFTKDINPTTITNAINVTNSSGAVAFEAVAVNNNQVKITLTQPIAHTVYHISVADSLTAATGEKMTTTKVFDIKTGVDAGFEAEAPTILSFTPTNNSKNVDVFSDMKVVFSKEMNQASLEQFVKINNGAIPFKIEKSSTNECKIIPLKNLDYNSNITVSFLDGVKSEDNGILEGKDYTFKTQRSSIDTLFTEEFNDPTALDRFTQCAIMDSNESYVVENGRLRIVCKTDTSEGADWKTPYYQKPVLKINGSDEWRDYEVQWEAYVPDASVQQANVVVRMEKSWEDGYESFVHSSNYYNSIKSTIRRIDDMWTAVPLTTSEETIPYVTGRSYNGKMSAIGSELKLTISDNDNNTVTKTATDATHAKGGIGFSGLEADAIFDNIVVTDKGFLFTPSNTKFSNGNITLTFNANLDATSINNAITVKNADGVTVPSIVTMGAENE